MHVKIVYEAAGMINSPEGWEFNYCWRKSGTLTLVEGLTDRQITMAVKKALSYTGLRAYLLWDFGDSKAYRLRGTCTGFNWRTEH